MHRLEFKKKEKDSISETKLSMTFHKEEYLQRAQVL
jgi:hypothetical protein